jgi:hypothetical protein
MFHAMYHENIGSDTQSSVKHTPAAALGRQLGNIVSLANRNFWARVAQLAQRVA